MDNEEISTRLVEISSRLDSMQEKIQSHASSIGSQASDTRWTVRLVALLIIIILGMISNPAKRAHVDKINEAKSFFETIGGTAINYQSFYAFSIATIEGEKDPSTFGVFGHVFMKGNSFPLKE